MLGIQPKFQTCDKQKNRENKTLKEKQSQAQDSIYVVRQFAYVHRVAGISLLSKKNYNVWLQCFSFSKTTTRQNPNHQKKRFLYPTHRIHNGLQNGPKRDDLLVSY